MRHQDIIDKMTLEEKCAILSGKTVWETRDVKRLGIPSIFCSDGPHGVRKQAGEGDRLGRGSVLAERTRVAWAGTQYPEKPVLRQKF